MLQFGNHIEEQKSNFAHRIVVRTIANSQNKDYSYTTEGQNAKDELMKLSLFELKELNLKQILS